VRTSGRVAANPYWPPARWKGSAWTSWPGRETGETLAQAGGIGGKTLVAGVVDGRNVWRSDLRGALSVCASLLDLAHAGGEHVLLPAARAPDVRSETTLAPELAGRLAFARQKVDEVVTLGRALTQGRDGITADLGATAPPPPPVNGRTRARLDALGDGTPRSDYTERRATQARGLPVLPTTTIGSFPQTEPVRKARADHKAGRIDDDAYERAMRAETDRVIALQEDIGLDVLVHGEPERNDMVPYFAERLDGFAATEHGWVQSYGTRYVRPPILHGDVHRPAPITVSWTIYAQSRTAKPVKGMLTGPVTMLAWSFVRDDQPLADLALKRRVTIHACCWWWWRGTGAARAGYPPGLWPLPGPAGVTGCPRFCLVLGWRFAP